MYIKAILNVPKESCRTCPYLTKKYVECGYQQGYDKCFCHIFRVQIYDYERCEMCKDSEVE